MSATFKELKKLSLANAKVIPNLLQTLLKGNFSQRDLVRNYLVDLGPFYGKILQILYSRNSSDYPLITDLKWILSDWPTIPWSEVEVILDADLPQWRDELSIRKEPLASATMGQVYEAYLKSGEAVVVKVLKPKSKDRLNDTVNFLREVCALLRKVPAVNERVLNEIDYFAQKLSEETSLEYEKKNILKQTSSRVLKIPRVFENFCSTNILCIEKFDGFLLKDVIEGKVELSSEDRHLLAQDLLKEVLVQIFESGFFHADPHGGNIMILKQGGIGLMDWGLAGSLTEKDRKYISSILRSLMTVDKKMLCETIYDIAQEDQNSKIDRKKIEQQFEKLLKVFTKKKQSGQTMSLGWLIQECLKTSDKLNIVLPQGLLMMAKTLVTIEAVSKGVSPDLSLGKIAGPILFKASKPTVKDLLTLIRKSPRIIKNFK